MILQMQFKGDNQHYVKSTVAHDPGQQFVVDAFTHHSVGLGFKNKIGTSPYFYMDQRHVHDVTVRRPVLVPFPVL